MNRKSVAAVAAFALAGGLAAVAATPVLTRFTAGTTAKSSEVNANFDAVLLAIEAVIPPGTVLAYAGATPPPGFLPCDGAAVSRTTYAALFSAISISHGGGDGVATFNLPDYRGRFLRGVNGTATAATSAATRDPDAAARGAMNPGGATGNAVGSIQDDAFRAHAHPTFPAVSSRGAGPDPFGNVTDFTTRTAATGEAGGAETRPANAYVNWIIKY